VQPPPSTIWRMTIRRGAALAALAILVNLGWVGQPVRRHPHAEQHRMDLSRMGKLALAQQHLTEGLDLAREVGDRYTEPLLLAGLADVHKDLARYDKAIELRLAAHEMIMAGMRGHERQPQRTG
jgi:hypothetical protein